MIEPIPMSPIATVESCYGEKFATPRQSGMVASASGRIVFSPEVDREACRGIEEFSHLWVVFLFDQVEESETRWLVRPPRLGGNEKKGVLATRSPFRPNRIGLSLVKLEKVEAGFLEVSGLDIVDGTPVLDIKPYLPYAEVISEARGGFAGESPERLSVRLAKGVAAISEARYQMISDSLAADPRPAYHDDPERVYGCLIAGYDVKWRVAGREVVIDSIEER